MKLIITPYETKINFLINHFTLYLVTYWDHQMSLENVASK
jgi:hypothetical protein